MANPDTPNESYRPNRTGDEFRDAALLDTRSAASSDGRSAASLDNKLQPDPELAEGPASSGRIALFAVAIAVVLGAVFYGLNNSSMSPNGTTTAQTAPANPSTADHTAPPVPPGVRDVTPRRSNTEPGTTTGMAPAQPQQQPQPSK
jgi:hypothetical protein